MLVVSYSLHSQHFLTDSTIGSSPAAQKHNISIPSELVDQVASMSQRTNSILTKHVNVWGKKAASRQLTIPVSWNVQVQWRGFKTEVLHHFGIVEIVDSDIWNFQMLSILQVS